MSEMPLARIYASSVEEAEPLRADLLARGYNVEVVFPDAEPSGPADLELRLEHCSPAQAVARVEADSGSPSRCVFLTPTKGPQHDLLLIEMTVAATGTHNRHPLYLPVNLPVANLVSIPQVEALAGKQTGNPSPSKAVVLPFPENVAAPAASAPTIGIDESSKGAINKKTDDDWNKLVGAEVTAFLAHAPQLEPVSFTGMLNEIGRSQIVTRVRNRWKGLTLLAVASSVLLLLYVGWHAGPTHPWQPSPISAGTVSARSPAAQTKAPVAARYVGSIGLSRKPAGRFVPARQALVPTLKVRTSRVRTASRIDRGEDLIAPDTIVRIRQTARRTAILRPVPAAGKVLISRTANPTRLAGMSPQPSGPAENHRVPIKKISDLK